MKKTVVTMPSVTHAVKARRIFSKFGYMCEIKKSPKVSEGGCTHVLIVYGDSGNVINFLNRNKIEYGKLLNGTVY